jgi:FixJ family two-component response regulator
VRGGKSKVEADRRTVWTLIDVIQAKSPETRMSEIMIVADRSGTKPRVVVVDGDPAVLHALKFALGIDGYDVRVYGSARELLDNADQFGNGGISRTEPACFVLDYRLPDMDGLELVAALRTRGFSAPAILITTNPNSAVRQRASDADINVVEKPLIGSALTNAVKAAVARRPVPASTKRRGP